MAVQLQTERPADYVYSRYLARAASVTVTNRGDEPIHGEVTLDTYPEDTWARGQPQVLVNGSVVPSETLEHLNRYRDRVRWSLGEVSVEPGKTAAIDIEIVDRKPHKPAPNLYVPLQLTPRFESVEGDRVTMRDASFNTRPMQGDGECVPEQGAVCTYEERLLNYADEFPLVEMVTRGAWHDHGGVRVDDTVEVWTGSGWREVHDSWIDPPIDDFTPGKLRVTINAPAAPEDRGQIDTGWLCWLPLQQRAAKCAGWFPYDYAAGGA